MLPQFETIHFDRASALASPSAEGRDVVVLSTNFNPGEKFSRQTHGDFGLSENSIHLLRECVRVLKSGGLLFVYGLPRELALWGGCLSEMRDDSQPMIFKYWIALDIDAASRVEFLKPTHLGLLMFWKNHPAGKTPAKFRLDTDAARIPHLNCAACGRTRKDWGGKKHLMNPRGAALSDVWRDLPRRVIRDNVIPEDVLARIGDLTRVEGGSCLHVIQAGAPASGMAHSVSWSSIPASAGLSGSALKRELQHAVPEAGAPMAADFTSVEPNQVHLGDCVSFLNRVVELHSEGLFDLAFADPPYNLQKLYGNYEDALAEKQYVEWCNRWLDGMARALKPGGSLLVLNLPKWAMHHAAFLNKRLEFRHWIVWDALSDPRGKLMPAHYALLWFTKPGAKRVVNYAGLIEGSEFRLQAAHSNASNRLKAELQTELVLPPDSPKYCLRAKCVKERKARGDDDKVELSDVWFDVHRIKHKRDRDAHPCQLPEKLMERIIRLTTRRGGWVFDPFCGAGTTAIAAAKLGRNFVVTDVDANYVRVTREKLAAMKENADLFGSFMVPRESVKKPRRTSTKREVELYLQSLARKLERVPTEKDVEADDATMLAKIDAIYPTRSAALKRAKVALADLV
ncbi:MAG TPA: site-specific DNA-methyltransferase [Verrucomicrobiae bacterium]